MLSARAQNFINETLSRAQEFAASSAKLLPVCGVKDAAAAEVRETIVAAGKRVVEDGRFVYVGKAGARAGDEVFIPAEYRVTLPAFDLAKVSDEAVKFLLRQAAARGECAVKE